MTILKPNDLTQQVELLNSGNILIRCWKCGDMVYSAYTYDCAFCSCQESFVDGGPQKNDGSTYYRTGGDDYEVFTKDLLSKIINGK